jgi:hypothetical protein
MDNPQFPNTDFSILAVKYLDSCHHQMLYTGKDSAKLQSLMVFTAMSELCGSVYQLQVHETSTEDDEK